MQEILQAEWERQLKEVFDDEFSAPEVQAYWRKRLIGKTEKEYLKAKLGGLIPVDDEGIGPKCVERLSGAVQVYSLCRQNNISWQEVCGAAAAENDQQDVCQSSAGRIGTSETGT